jgi:hypothetical protein
MSVVLVLKVYVRRIPESIFHLRRLYRPSTLKAATKHGGQGTAMTLGTSPVVF